jgi:hypothetical protein
LTACNENELKKILKEYILLEREAEIINVRFMQK